MKKIIISLLLLTSSFWGFSQSVDGMLKTLTASGTDTYRIDHPLPATYDSKEKYLVRFTNACSSCSSATLNRYVNGSPLGAKSIKYANGASLGTGAISNGDVKLLAYNGTYYQIVGILPPSSGISNSAGVNELMLSDGVNAVPSGLFNPSTADFYMGTGKSGTTRVIQADGSGADINLSILSKGAGNIIIGAFGNVNIAGVGSTGTTIGGSSISSGTAPDNSYKGTSASGTGVPGKAILVGGGSGVSGTAGGDAYVNGGSASVGNTNGGSVAINGGAKNGSGINGPVNIGLTNIGAINIGASTSTLGFFGATAVVKQSSVTTTQGIADALTSYGLLPSSTIGGTSTITTIINIGDWNMDSNENVTVSLGSLDVKKIRSVDVIVRNDTDDGYTKLEQVNQISGVLYGGHTAFVIGSPSIIGLWRLTGGAYDGTDYDATSYNRGYITITSIP